MQLMIVLSDRMGVIYYDFSTFNLRYLELTISKRHILPRESHLLTSLEKKRIAIVTERIAPFYRGGAEEVMYRYAEILAKQHDVSIFTSFDEGVASKKIGNVRFNYISRNIKKNNKKGNHSLTGILSFSVAVLFHRKLIVDFDIVILDSIHYFYPKSFLRFLKRKNCKVITLFHEAWYEYRKSGAVSPLLSYFMGIFIRRLICNSDTVISVSDPTTKSLISNYSVGMDKVVTIPLGIDYKDIIDRYSFREISDRHYDLVFVGRFAAIKRISDVVEAVSLLTKRGKKIEVALIGDGPQRRLLEQKIEKIGLSKSFHVFGFLNENEKYSTMANSKIFILPSEREGFSLSTLEAMALGCIPIVSKPKFDEVFGVSHFVKNGENGLYYLVGNVDELAQCISDLLENQKISELLSTNALKTAKLYTTNEMARRIYDVLEQITS